MSTPVHQPTTSSVSRRRRHHPLVVALLWLVSIAAILAIACVIAANIFLRRAGPMLQAKVVETLSTRFDSRVELDQFHAAFFRGFEVTGAGLKLYPNHLDITEPMIAVDRFSFRVLDWRQLLHSPLYIDRVQVSGLSIHLPPKSQRANMPHLTQSQKPGVDQSHGRIQVLVGEIDVNQAGLVIENGKPGKVPLDFIIQKIRLTSVGAGRPMKFHAILINPRPTGNIDSTGDFGPFNEHSPGDTPVDGTYTFRNADLSTIKGIGGILSSDGSYQGQLNNIVVDGTTTTPDFSLDIAARPVPLSTKFHAIVDGTNGDVHLQPVDAWLAKTHIVARGDVVRVAGVPGRDIRLDVTVGPGQIQDILLLAVKSQPPLMNGEVGLHTKFNLPPGPDSVTHRLQLRGQFSLGNTVFTSDKVQSKVDELSLRGQGKPKEAARASALEAASAQPGAAGISSEMRGEFTLDAHKLTLSALNYRVPGADIALTGTYDLDAQSLDFTGLARLDAHISQMVTGWKSWLLKPVDPFFAKDGAGTQVPIRIGGTSSHPDISLNYKQHDQKPKPPSNPPPAPANPTAGR